jgi:ATP synthase protein I
MPSNDVRNLAQIAVPAAAAGVIAVAVSAAVAGGKGALGAAVGTLLAVLFMGIGLYVLQWTAKTLPQLFQAMGLMLYMAQLLLLLIFVAVFKGTSLFNAKTFAVSLVVTTVVWMAAQARAHMKAKIFYVDPNPEKSEKREKTGPSS